MLTMIFQAGKNHYALVSKEIVEVLPLVHLRSVPHAPDYVAGILNYHASLLPVIDICQLFTGLACKESTSSRIIVANYILADQRRERVGLLVEQATDTLHIDETLLTDPVVDIVDAPYLGKNIVQGDRTIQLVNVEQLLGEDVQKLLYKLPGEMSDATG